jgi:hypothetical protein
LTMFRAFAVFLQGWVNAEGTPAGTGLEDMRGGVACASRTFCSSTDS